jgi:hypothetical protein
MEAVVVAVDALAAVSFAGGAIDAMRRFCVETVAASRHWLRPSQIGMGNVGGNGG